MQSLVIVGGLSITQEYIKDFSSTKKIKSYNLIEFKERIKISDVREIKKLISFKQSADETRLIVIREILFEAQNAILKTLEELPDNTFFIIVTSNKETLLPTILSRSQIIYLKGGTEKSEISFKNEIEEMITKKDKTALALSIAEKIESAPDLLKDFLLELRSELLKAGIQEKKERLHTLHAIIYKLSIIYPLLIRNNINKRMAVEYVLLSAN